MNDRDQRDAAMPMAQGSTASDAAADRSSGGEGGDRPAEFSRLEWQRLLFLRWLWREGRLSDQI